MNNVLIDHDLNEAVANSVLACSIWARASQPGLDFDAFREREYPRKWFAERDAMLRVTNRAIA